MRGRCGDGGEHVGTRLELPAKNMRAPHVIRFQLGLGTPQRTWKVERLSNRNVIANGM